MDHEPIQIVQLPLFVYGEPVKNIIELFPAVWIASEQLTSAEASQRQKGIDALLEMGAQKVSPLVAYLIATCLSDPDLFIRRRVAFILADLISGGTNGQQIPEEVRAAVTHYVHNANEATVYGLLEVSVADPQADQAIYHLFNSCPYAGKYLGDLLAQWKHPLSIRQKAVYFIGLVGYLEALPVLERMLNRLEARQNGQFAMAFAPPASKTDDELLPYLRVAINQLNTR
ncbi:MAG: hypothetical protein ACM3H7_05570 [Acidobacteriaceae bacterium]